MEKGAKYVVTTHWGTFSLDEASYQDYLNGRHWICWEPGDKPKANTGYGKMGSRSVSEKAVALRESADKFGVVAVLKLLEIHDAIVPYSSVLDDVSIDELNLSVRSSNGLKRANAGTMRALKELLSKENGIMSIRNLGQKSSNEIKRVFFEECYNRLLAFEKDRYWQNVLDSLNEED